MRERLVAARSDCLRELVSDWKPERHPELDPLLRRLAQEIAPTPLTPNSERALSASRS